MRLGQLVLLAALFIVPFLTSAQSWDTVRIVDFSNPSFTDSLTGVQGFAQQGFERGNNGASGSFNDLCAFTSSFSAQDRIAMRVSLVAGVDYRVSLNGKVNRTGQAVNFAYAPASNLQQVTVISQSIQLADIHYEDPGATVQSDTFSVAADGNYWVAVEHGGANLPDVFARLDNFMVEALQEAPMPSLSLTDNDGNPITSGIEAEPGTPFMLCLSPDSAPAENMDLELSIDGDGSPHFSDFTTTPLTFLAGTADSICFELSPASDTTTGTYTFKFEHGNDIVMDFQVVVELCSVAGPDQTICGGESVQLGTGNLTEPSGVDYCYVWEPSTGLDNPGSSMPNASPLETTTYTVYVTSSEGDVICVDEVTVFVNQIEIQNGTIPEICAGEMVTISVNPIGQGPFSYTWETGENTASIDVSPEFGKSYLVAITDESTSCSKIKEVQVTVYQGPNIDIVSVYPSICVPDPNLPGLQPEESGRVLEGGASGACMNSTNTLYALPSYPGYEFQWSTGATEYNIDTDIPGLYSVTVTNSNGCSSSKSVDLGSCVDVSITPSISSSGEAMLDAGAGTFGATYSYLWHDGTTNQTIPIDELGFYSVTVVDENGCSGNDKEFVDAYYYDSDNIFLVFATYISPENSTNIEDGELHIYLCNNTVWFSPLRIGQNSISE